MILRLWHEQSELLTRIILLTLAGAVAYVVISAFSGTGGAPAPAKRQSGPEIIGGLGADGNYFPGTVWREGGKEWVSLGGGSWRQTQ